MPNRWQPKYFKALEDGTLPGWRLRRRTCKIWQTLFRRTPLPQLIGWPEAGANMTQSLSEMPAAELLYSLTCVCVRARVRACVRARPLLRSNLYWWMTHPVVTWLINHCSYYASAWFSPPFVRRHYSSFICSAFQNDFLFFPISSSLPSLSLPLLSTRRRRSVLPRLCYLLSRLISGATLGIYQTAIKKLSFNKIIAFIYFFII